jgi:hypothetical protein
MAVYAVFDELDLHHELYDPVRAMFYLYPETF